MVTLVRFLGLLVLVVVAWPSLRSHAAAPLPEDQDIYGDYRVIGDRVLLKNPNASVHPVHLMYRTQDGLGTTWWENDIRVTNDTSNANNPSVAIESAYLHVAWKDDRVGGECKVFYKRSINLGQSWEEDVLISVSPERVEDASPDISLSTNCLHAVWGYTWKPIFEQGHIYCRRSVDHGETWEDVYFLSSYEAQSRPSIAALEDTVYVIFARYIEADDRYELHFRKSSDEGENWTEDRVIADYGPSLVRGTLHANEHGLHYVFNHDDNFDDPGNPDPATEVFYINSPDFGETWTDPIIVSHRDSIHSQWPSMCVDDKGTVHVTWFDYKYSPYSWTGDIFYTKSTDKSTDSGQFWSEIQVLTDAHTANSSHIIASSGHLYLVWEDQRNQWNNYDVFFKHSRDGGDSWDVEERLTDVRQDSYEPVIAQKADSLYVVWSDKRDDPTNRKEEIYFKRGGLEAVSPLRSTPAEQTASLSLASFPNPFNHNAIIQYAVVEAVGSQTVSLRIYNISGRLVKVLVDDELVAGQYQSVWDGTDSKETRVSSGVYLCVLQGEHDRRVNRLVYLK